MHQPSTICISFSFEGVQQYFHISTTFFINFIDPQTYDDNGYDDQNECKIEWNITVRFLVAPPLVGSSKHVSQAIEEHHYWPKNRAEQTEKARIKVNF
jgi:hypothetical protein